MFAMGPAVVPNGGMEEMPRVLYEKLQGKNQVSFRFGSNVSSIKNNTVKLISEEEIKVDHIVCACDPWSLHEIEGARTTGEECNVPSPLTTFYVKTGSLKYNDRSLVLPVGNYKINHIAPLGRIYDSPEPYISVNVLDLETNYDVVLGELCRIYRTQKSSFDLIDIKKVYNVLPNIFHLTKLK